MPHGGRRPGAGAPRGNLNALKHGLHSRQLQHAVEELACSPRFRAILARFAQLAAQERLVHGEEQTAMIALAARLRYARALELGKRWVGPPPPPLSKRALRLLARRLAGEAIKENAVGFSRNAPETGEKT